MLDHRLQRWPSIKSTLVQRNIITSVGLGHMDILGHYGLRIGKP